MPQEGAPESMQVGQFLQNWQQHDMSLVLMMGLGAGMGSCRDRADSGRTFGQLPSPVGSAPHPVCL